MNVLFFTYDFPYPTTSGGKTRAYNLLKFGQKNAKVTLVSFVREPFDKSSLKNLHAIGVDDVVLLPRKKLLDVRNVASFISGKSLLWHLYFDTSIQQRLISIAQEKNIQLIHFESFYTGVYISQVFSDMSVKQIYGSENIEYLLYKDQAKHASFAKKQFFQSQIGTLKKEEAEMYRSADATLTVTETEKKYVQSLADRPCYVIPNGVNPTDFSVSKKSDGRTLLFIGNFTYFPNVDAITFFMQHVFNSLPEGVRLLVVGKKATSLSCLKHPRATVFEHVDAIAKAYEQADIFVSPMRVGGGTNFKVLEAMASRVPVVALSDRVKDFGFTDGKELLIANNAGEFVEKVRRLLEDTVLQEKIRKEAKTTVVKRYNWQDIGESLYTVWRKVLL